jgi:Zn-finger nucleic acid-binding protein
MNKIFGNQCPKCKNIEDFENADTTINSHEKHDLYLVSCFFTCSKCKTIWFSIHELSKCLGVETIPDK